MNVHRWFLVFVLIVEALIFSLILFYYSERFVFLFCKIVVRFIYGVACVLLRRRSLGWKMCLFNCAISFVLLGLSSIVLKKLTENV